MSDELRSLIEKASEDEAKDRDKTNALRASISYGATQNPDAYAKATRLAAESGATPQAVLESPDAFENAGKVQAFDFDGFIRNTPRLASWASTPDNAAIAHDDLETLSTLEKFLQPFESAYAEGGRLGVAKKAMSDTLHMWSDTSKQLLLTPGRAMAGSFRAVGGGNQLIGQLAIDAQKPDASLGKKLLAWGLAPHLAMNPEMAADEVQIGKDIRDYYTPMFTDPALQPETTAGKGAEFVGGIAGTMGKAVLSGPAAPLVFGVEAAGNKAGDALETGATSGQALAEGAGSGFINTAMAFIPGGNTQSSSILKMLAGRTVRGVALGAGTTVSENLLTRIHRDDVPLTEGMTENIASFIGLEYAGAFQHRAQLKRIVEAAAESKLKARSPEKFQEAAEVILKDSALDQVMVPAERFQTFFQEAGMDPAKVAEQVGAKNYLEAVAAGTDVLIPTAGALAKLPKEHLQGLMADVRVREGEMTAREAEAYQLEAPARIAQMMEEARAELPDEQFQAFQEIKLEVQRRLEETGMFSPALAADNASLVAKGLVNKGLREGLDPTRLLEDYGLAIQGPGTPMPEGVTFSQKGKYRGAITFGENNKVSIAVLERANASTFVHELGHFWLKMQADLAQRPEATEQIRSDLSTIVKWMGLSSLDQIQKSHHEQFARAHEAYLREGRAPTPELAGSFARFRTWLKAIYRRLSGLNVNLTDEVRQVFDRLYASDAEIEQAREAMGGDRPLFDTAESAGMTQAEFEGYRKAHAKGSETAQATLDKRLQAEVDRTQVQWWKDELAKVRDEVAPKVDSEPIYQAFRTLSEGTLGDGKPFKLNRADLVAQFGEGVLKELPRQGAKWLYTREGGMDAEAAAEILGFESGTRLIQELKAMRPREERIQARAESEMKRRHGDLLTDGSIAEAALEAIHNQPREERMMLELKALRKREEAAARTKADARATVKAIPHIQTFRDAARDLVDQSPIRNLDPYRYMIASRKASREAFEALGKGQFGKAGDAKQREILNHHLFLEALKGKKEAEGIAAHGKEAQGERIQSILGKAGSDFQEQYNQILESVEFAKVTNKALDARSKSLAQWVAEQTANDAPIAFDPESIPRKNWRELNRVELRAVSDALANIETIARAIVNRTRDGKTVEYEGMVTEFDQKTEGRRSPVRKSGSSVGFAEKVKDASSSVIATLKKMEWVIDKLDNSDIDGPARAMILDPINKGQVRFEEIQHQVLESIAKVVLARPKADQRDSMKPIGVKLPGFDRELNRNQAISLLFNMGTLENRNATLGGYKLIDADGSVAPELHQAFGKLRASEIQYVQKIWDVLESFWPMDSEFQKKLTGIAPGRKVLAPFALESVEGQKINLRGGYFPLVGASEGRVNRMQEGMDLAQIFSEGWSAPSTSKSRFKKVTGATYEVMLDHEYILTRHMDKMARDLAFREPAFQVAHALRDPRVSKIIQETVGVEYEREMLPWLKDVVNGDRISVQDKSDVFLRGMLNRRSKVAAAALGFNIASAIKQVTDPLKAVPILKGKSHYLVSAWAKIRLNPEKWIAEIREMSPEVMKYREESYSRELRQITESKSAFEQGREKYGEAGYALLGIMDHYNSFPIYLALFEKAMDETGGNRAKSIKIADRDANMVLQAGRTKDLSPMFRKKGYAQLFTMFGNEANTYFNLIAGMVGRKDAAGAGLALFAASASNVIGKALVGQMPEDKDKRAAWLLKNASFGVLGTVPFLEDTGKAMYDSATGFKADTQYSPMVSLVTKPAKAMKSIADAWEEDDAFKNWKALIDTADAAGTWFGVEGTTQLTKAARYLNKVGSGEEVPETKLEAARKAVLGTPPKR